MEAKRIEELGEQSLAQEQECIRRIICKRIHNEDASEEIEELRILAGLTNQLIASYLATGQEAEIGKKFYKAVDLCTQYNDLENKRVQLENHYDVEEDLSYRIKRLSFALHYNQKKEILDRLLNYFDGEGEKPNVEEVVKQFTECETDILPIRNYLLGTGFQYELPIDDLNILNNRPFVAAMVQMNLGHYKFKWAIQLIQAFCNYQDIDTVVPAAFLNMELAISMYQDLAKKGGFTLDCLDPLIEEMKETIAKLPGIEEHPEVLSEIEHIVESSDQLSKKYHNQDQK